MVLVKILGLIDLTAALAFLMLMFGLSFPAQFLMFCIGLLLLKGMFIFTGEIILSGIDLISAILLLLSFLFTLPSILLWIPALFLFAKGISSFI